MQHQTRFASERLSYVARERLRCTPIRFLRGTHVRVEYDYRKLGGVGVHIVDALLSAALYADLDEDN